jgi:lysozyme
MKTSSAGLAFVGREEGTVLHIYKDVAGLETIGVGHLLTASEKANNTFANGITHQQAMDLLAVDICTAESWVNKGVKLPITQNMFDACVSFTFNEGGGGFTGSTLLKLLNEDNLAGAADEFLKWDKTVINGVLQADAALLARRRRERTLFLTPDAATVAPAAAPVVTEPVPVVIPSATALVADPVSAPMVASSVARGGWQIVWNIIMMIVKFMTKRGT